MARAMQPIVGMQLLVGLLVGGVMLSPLGRFRPHEESLAPLGDALADVQRHADALATRVHAATPAAHARALPDEDEALGALARADAAAAELLRDRTHALARPAENDLLRELSATHRALGDFARARRAADADAMRADADAARAAAARAASIAALADDGLR